jgi:hypothetical protein
LHVTLSMPQTSPAVKEILALLSYVSDKRALFF